MGEIADQMINGETCAMCGVPLNYSKEFTGDGEPYGIPMYCSEECAMSQGVSKKDAKYRIYSK